MSRDRNIRDLQYELNSLQEAIKRGDLEEIESRFDDVYCCYVDIEVNLELVERFINKVI